MINAATLVMAQYPAEVWREVLHPLRGIPGRTSRLTLQVLRDALEEAYAPLARELARDRALQSHLRSLPPSPKRTAEQQARIDERVAQVRRAFGLPPEGRQ